MKVHEANNIIKFFSLLNQNLVEYRLIKNISDELPYHLRLDKDIDLLISKKSWMDFQKICKKNHIIELEHPFGFTKGFSTLYGASEPHMYLAQNGLMIDVSIELCVKCLDMPAWIPLDIKINEAIWKEKIWNKVLECWQLKEEILVCYLIARCIFDKKNFSDAYINEIEKRKSLLEEKEVQMYLQSIFFGYTPILLQKIGRKEYKEIIGSYISYKDY